MDSRIIIPGRPVVKNHSCAFCYAKICIKYIAEIFPGCYTDAGGDITAGTEGCPMKILAIVFTQRRKDKPASLQVTEELCRLVSER
jgi:hypothetical protein